MDKADETPLRIGVLADSHLTATAETRQWLRALVEQVFEPVDMILHAGDLVDPELLDVLADYPHHVVRGNMDPATLGVPVKKIVRVADVHIGLIHGWGPSAGLEDRIAREFDDVSLDCLVYGHSHRPACHHRDGVLFFNPGSATDRRAMAYHSVGLLEVGTGITGTIIRLD